MRTTKKKFYVETDTGEVISRYADSVSFSKFPDDALDFNTRKRAQKVIDNVAPLFPANTFTIKPFKDMQ